jgi:hypothetical protein
VLGLSTGIGEMHLSEIVNVLEIPIIVHAKMALVLSVYKVEHTQNFMTCLVDDNEIRRIGKQVASKNGKDY